MAQLTPHAANVVGRTALEILAIDRVEFIAKVMNEHCMTQREAIILWTASGTATRRTTGI